MVDELLPFSRQEFCSAALEFGELRGKEDGRLVVEVTDFGKSIALYLIVLARTTVIKYDQVSRVAVELIERATQNNVNEILSAVEVILLETLFVQRSDGQMIYSVFRSKSTNLFKMSSQRTLLLWTLFLHSSRNDENSWSSMSIDFFAAYSEFSTECSESAFNHSVFAVVTTFACMAPAMYRPVDGVFHLLQNSVAHEDIPLSVRLKQSVPLLFAIFNNVAEEKLLMRIEQKIEKPLEWLVSRIYDLLLSASSASAKSDGLFVDYTIFLFQATVNLIKAENYPKLCAALQTRLKNVEYLPIHRLVATQPALLSQWLQLMNLCDEPLTKHLDFNLCTEYVVRLAVSLSPLSTELTLPSPIKDKANCTPVLPTESPLVEFCRAVFSGSLWCRNPRVFRTLLSLESPDIYYVYECVAEDKRECFLGHLLNSISTGLVSQMVFPDAYKAAVAKSQEVLDVVYDLVEFEGEANKDALRLKLFVLSRLSLLVTSNHDLIWGDFTSNELVALLEFAAVEMTLPKCNLRATYEGLIFLLEHKSTRDIFARDILYGIQSIKKVLQSVLLILGEKNPSKFDHLSVSDKISVVASNSAVFSSDFEEFGGLDGFLVTLFNDVHDICHVFRSHSRKDVQYFEKFCRVILRHPVLHRFAIVPYTALKMNWKLRVELRENTLHVPLVNIHLLCNIDILKDFSWRLNWLGWISRQQFEDFWMSLFGVLSSTPTGSELTTENSSNLAEQILASSFAVSVLTDILIYSLIYPEPGNPSTGRFIIKHRERNEPFYQSKSMQLLCLLKARLTRDQEPLQAYRRNLERLNYMGDEYGFGQLSALSLWTLTGVLNDENPHQLVKTDSPRMRISLSEYLLKTTCELDTASSIRALFENFAHWFARGLDHLPLPLLTSSVKSMALLSDLFDDSASYEFLYAQMRNVFRGGFLTGHPDIGYVIYSMLKAVTVIGLENAARGMTEADMAKQIFTWVEYGLTFWSPFVREATLHGFIYLMQSMTLDPLKAVVQYVTGFLLEETKKQLSVTDPINVIDMPASLEYSNLLWSVSFRIMEEPLQVSFKNTLIQRTCETFTVMNLSSYLLPVVTSGIEALALHSASYLPQFLQLVHGCLVSYATISSTFPYALRILIACIFREELDPRRASAHKFEPVLEELYNVYRRCDVRDAELISLILPSVLLRLYPEERVLGIILSFCAPSKDGSYSSHITHSLRMMFEFFERIRDNQRLSSLLVFAQQVLSHLQAKTSTTTEDRAVATCMLCAVSSYEDIAYRFHVYLASLHSSDNFEESYKFLLRKVAEESSQNR
ncbi:hypothetical protein Y032_0002g846 [Ancylostoma ceylanicum]|uniref:Uncharacterized protein n=1 Tax=Ancylostoma ceylanicum TaxID=53326 RepID=A0A016W2Q6_9BILA|nr:hypothetical protein Y032_0002g846 [Ancylostoma ceylanicum]